ncbi:MAG TPA: matrixin family metalloprotease [Bdellovibrionales bacterium]|jgi:hypothetical protein|nr:matrixin family metalloprotease [Bdellovibrionales bacterium]
MVRRIVFIFGVAAIALALNACAKKPEAEESCNFVQNRDQQRISWGASLPVRIYIDDSVEKQFHDDIMAAAKKWNEKIGHEVLRVSLATSRAGKPAQDGDNFIYQLKTWERDRMQEQARTTVYWSGDRIHEADIRINDAAHEFATSSVLLPNRIDIESLLVHEFGHVLGLAHSDAPGSVMAKTLPSATPRREPSKSDLNSISCEY